MQRCTLIRPAHRAHPWLAAAAALALAGCNPENQAQAAYTPSNSRTATRADDTTRYAAITPPPPDTLAPPPSGAAATVALAPPDASPVRASAELRATSGGTAVAVRLTGGTPLAHYQGAIRRGACDRLGAQRASLNAVSASALGAGRAFTSTDVPLDSLRASAHVVVYGEGGLPEVCGAIR